jgi:hypothetical protein
MHITKISNEHEIARKRDQGRSAGSLSGDYEQQGLLACNTMQLGKSRTFLGHFPYFEN